LKGVAVFLVADFLVGGVLVADFLVGGVLVAGFLVGGVLVAGFLVAGFGVNGSLIILKFEKNINIMITDNIYIKFFRKTFFLKLII
jgi:hypothetical protein